MSESQAATAAREMVESAGMTAVISAFVMRPRGRPVNQVKQGVSVLLPLQHKVETCQQARLTSIMKGKVIRDS